MSNPLLGSKGGKGAGGSFRNRPDNLRSTDTFEALIGLTTGRIRGLAPGGLKNYLVNNVPLEDGAGNQTLEDFSVMLFNGDPAVLEPITLQLGGSSGPVSVNLPIDNNDTSAATSAGPAGDWRFGTVTQINVDYIDLRFIVTELFKQDSKGIYDATASLQVELQASGSATWINPILGVTAPTYNEDGMTFGGATGRRLYLMRSVYSPGNINQWNDSAPGLLQITGKTTQAYVKELRIAVPNTGAYLNKTWTVRVRLMERDSFTSDAGEERRTVAFDSIAGVSKAPIGGTEDWRGVSYIQLNGKASAQLTGIPELNGIFDLCEVKVPPASVWNADTQQYTGATWDGATEEIRWTRCPAFQLKDLIEDDISGISGLVPGSTLNKWDVLEASKWYSQLVPDGKGGTHPRYTMNYVLENPQSITETIQYVAGATGAFAWDRGDGNWRMRVEKPENYSMLFTKENIIGEFSGSHTDIDGRFNDIVGVFVNEELGFKEDRVRVYDQDHIDTYGRKSTTFTLVGCTNRQEALRRIYIRLLSLTKETKQFSFITNRQGLLLEPFSVIGIADSDLGNRDDRTTGRLVHREGTTVLTGDYTRLELGVSYEIHVTIPNPDYDSESANQPSTADWKSPSKTIVRSITNSAGQRGDVKTLYLNTALPANTPKNANFALVAIGLPAIPKQFRVISIQKSDEENDELVSISAVEIYTSKWAESDAIVEADVLAQKRGQVKPPTNMTGVVIDYPATYQTKRILSVKWDRPVSLFFDGFKVEYAVNGSPPVVVDEKSLQTFLEIKEPLDGLYRVNVYAKDRRGGISLPVTAEYTVGDLPPPGTSRVEVSDPTVTIKAYVNGQALPNQLPRVGNAVAYVGDRNVTALATWTVQGYGCTVSINAAGMWTISAVAASGSLVINALFEGANLTYTIPVTKDATTPLPPGGAGGGGAPVVYLSQTWPTVTSTSYGTPPFNGVVNSGTSGKIEFYINVSYSSSGTSAVLGKMQYRPTAGGGWSDVAAEVLGSNTSFSYEDTSPPSYVQEPGFLSAGPIVVSGLTINTDYDFSAIFRKSSGPNVAPTGYVSAQGNIP